MSLYICRQDMACEGDSPADWVSILARERNVIIRLSTFTWQFLPNSNL